MSENPMNRLFRGGRAVRPLDEEEEAELEELQELFEELDAAVHPSVSGKLRTRSGEEVAAHEKPEEED